MATKTEARASAAEEFWDLLKVVLQALAIAFVVRLFLFQPFVIPSSSMEGTLLIGDYIFVSKYSYGYSKYSFAIPTWFWSEIIPYNFSGRILPGAPSQGDVIVFRNPNKPDLDYIKRLVALPGDTIQMQDGVLYINNKAVPKKRIADHIEWDAAGNEQRVPQFQETLPNGAVYHVLDRQPDTEFDDTQPVRVPEGYYFMMGDNRDNSSDSRDKLNGVGFVPFENLVGKAQIVFFSHNSGASLLLPWTWPTGIRWTRFFGFIR